MISLMNRIRLPPCFVSVDDGASGACRALQFMVMMASSCLMPLCLLMLWLRPSPGPLLLRCRVLRSWVMSVSL